MSSQGDSLQPPVPVAFRRGPAKVHGVAKLACLEVRFCDDSCGFWSDFGSFGGAKMDAKIVFFDVFLRCFFECVFSSFWGAFLEAPNLKK